MQVLVILGTTCLALMSLLKIDLHLAAFAEYLTVFIQEDPHCYLADLHKFAIIQELTLHIHRIHFQ